MLKKCRCHLLAYVFRVLNFLQSQISVFMLLKPMLQDFPKMIAVAHSPLTRVLIPHVFQKSECLLFQKDSVAHILCSIIYSISRSTSGSNYSLTLEPCAIENPHRSNNQSSVYVVPPYPSFLCIYSSTYTDSTSYDYTVLGYLLLKS